MILIEDTRQQKGKHNNVHKYCDSQGIEIYPLTLTVGDYMLGEVQNGKVVPIGKCAIDTKFALIELANDLSKDEQALDKKYRKCYEQGIKLIVLIEEPFGSVQEIANWKNPHGFVNGRKLLDKMHRLKMMYGIDFMFCDKKRTGETLIKLLKGV